MITDPLKYEESSTSSIEESQRAKTNLLERSDSQDNTGIKQKLTPEEVSAVYKIPNYAIQNILDEQEIKTQHSQLKLSVSEWTKMFLKRHKQGLLKDSSMNEAFVVDRETLQDYFNYLKMAVHGVKPRSIYSFDEINLSNDQDLKKVVTKRVKTSSERSEAVGAFTLVVCGNAAGDMLPPCVTYKSDKILDMWTTGGPPNTGYYHSTTGWFTRYSFVDWFFTIVLPVLSKQEGKKLLIGDYLNMHLSSEIKKECARHNIVFVPLPPNSTRSDIHPLHVAFNQPVYEKWRLILSGLRSQNGASGRVTKNRFPFLLKQLWGEIERISPDRLKFGFFEAGICPVDELLATIRFRRLEHLKRSGPPKLYTNVLQIVEEYKESQGRKLNLPPGISISSAEVKYLLNLGQSHLIFDE